MCLLMMCLPGECPSEEYLANACFNNSDGFGFAVHTGSEIITGRGMHPDRTISKFYEALASTNGDGIGLFHARLTTHGKTNTDNCHPFRVGGNKNIILGHNGVLPISAPGDRSDTRIFAEDILPAMGIEILDDKSDVSRLEQWMSGSKMVILSNDKRLKEQVYILNEDAGHWDKGIWWSNTSYQSRYYWNYSGYYAPTVGDSTGGWSMDNDYSLLVEETCIVCTSVLRDDDYDDGICQVCNTCLECNDNASSCMCWSPTNKGQRPRWWEEEVADNFDSRGVDGVHRGR
jgi:hypothetical protein